MEIRRFEKDDPGQVEAGLAIQVRSGESSPLGRQSRQRTDTTASRAPRGGDPTADVHEHLDRLVDELKDGERIRTALVERAFRTVERHRFLREFSRWDPATLSGSNTQF